MGEHYIEYADALMELRLLPEAAGAARLAVAEFSAAGIPLMAAEAQLRVAQLALLTGDPAEADRGLDGGRGRRSRQPDPVGLAGPRAAGAGGGTD